MNAVCIPIYNMDPRFQILVGRGSVLVYMRLLEEKKGRLFHMLIMSWYEVSTYVLSRRLFFFFNSVGLRTGTSFELLM